MAGLEIALKQEFPEATEAECRRFVRACQGASGNVRRHKSADQVKADAEAMLEGYLDWRSSYGMARNDSERPSHEEDGGDDDDAAMWGYAVRRTVDVLSTMEEAREACEKLAEEAKKEASKKEENGRKVVVNYDVEFSDSQNSDEGEKCADGKGERTDIEDIAATEKLQTAQEIRQIVFLHQRDGKPITDRNGNKVLCVLPAMIDKERVSAESYGIALSFYFEHLFDRDSEEKVTVLLDVRAGEGWPNTSAVFMINYIRHLAKMLHGHYPERLERMVVFPVPRAALGVWAAVKRVFHASIMGNIVLCPGPAESSSPLPKDHLQEYVDEAILDFIEEDRIGRFDPTCSSG